MNWKSVKDLLRPFQGTAYRFLTERLGWILLPTAVWMAYIYLEKWSLKYARNNWIITGIINTSSWMLSLKAETQNSGKLASSIVLQYTGLESSSSAAAAKNAFFPIIDFYWTFFAFAANFTTDPFTYCLSLKIPTDCSITFLNYHIATTNLGFVAEPPMLMARLCRQSSLSNQVTSPLLSLLQRVKRRKPLATVLRIQFQNAALDCLVISFNF